MTQMETDWNNNENSRLHPFYLWLALV